MISSAHNAELNAITPSPGTAYRLLARFTIGVMTDGAVDAGSSAASTGTDGAAAAVAVVGSVTGGSVDAGSATGTEFTGPTGLGAVGLVVFGEGDPPPPDVAGRVVVAVVATGGAASAEVVVVAVAMVVDDSGTGTVDGVDGVVGSGSGAGTIVRIHSAVATVWDLSDSGRGA